MYLTEPERQSVEAMPLVSCKYSRTANATACETNTRSRAGSEAHSLARSTAILRAFCEILILFESAISQLRSSNQSREAYARIVPVPEMAAILAFFRRLAHEVPWAAALCATALLEEEVVEIARTVGRALVQHYGVRPEWGAANYTVHEAIEQEESGQTKQTILGHLRTAEDRRAAGAAMREMHDLLVAYADGLARRYPA